MNEYLLAALAMLASLAAPLWVAHRRQAVEAVVALSMVSTAMVGVLLALTAGFGRSAFFELPEVLAVLSFVGTLAFARFLERWV